MDTKEIKFKVSYNNTKSFLTRTLTSDELSIINIYKKFNINEKIHLVTYVDDEKDVVRLSRDPDDAAEFFKYIKDKTVVKLKVIKRPAKTIAAQKSKNAYRRVSIVKKAMIWFLLAILMIIYTMSFTAFILFSLIYFVLSMDVSINFILNKISPSRYK